MPAKPCTSTRCRPASIGALHVRTCPSSLAIEQLTVEVSWFTAVQYVLYCMQYCIVVLYSIVCSTSCRVHSFYSTLLCSTVLYCNFFGTFHHAALHCHSHPQATNRALAAPGPRIREVSEKQLAKRTRQSFSLRMWSEWLNGAETLLDRSKNQP